MISAEAERQIELLKIQVRVGDACSHYHMIRCKLLEEANENANKAIQSLTIEIEKLYQLLNRDRRINYGLACPEA